MITVNGEPDDNYSRSRSIYFLKGRLCWIIFCNSSGLNLCTLKRSVRKFALTRLARDHAGRQYPKADDDSDRLAMPATTSLPSPAAPLCDYNWTWWREVA